MRPINSFDEKISDNAIETLKKDIDEKMKNFECENIFSP